ncbi:hypothetical protein [Halosimplex salinum]|uniref:hypothetical protein n=1 Tax=Halosimplex salinum TaxID=1710538 RepID=UPI000F49E99E|nr:hypothetical protein [Halosimplex salinum]
MDLAVVVLGALTVAMGLFAIKFPMRIRSFVSPSRWTDDPETAETYQRIWAVAVGTTIVALGLVTVGIGLTTG